MVVLTTKLWFFNPRISRAQKEPSTILFLMFLLARIRKIFLKRYSGDNMNMTIRDILGPKWYEIKLYDNNSLSYGGISRPEETLGEFIENSDLNAYEDSIGLLQITLEKCGICRIYKADSIVQEMIEKELDELEEKLGVKLDIKYWDYKEL